jgi:NADPH-dependent glutamate synthase beta subunit-like oxidoreductase
VVDKEIAQILEMGIEVKTNTRVGGDITFVELLRTHDACFVATGAHRSMKLGIPGEESEGVISGLEFLKKVALGEGVDLGRRVVVVGGGNTALDAARSSKRLGAEEVAIVYRRSPEEMPAYREEVQEAEKEGIRILYMTAPIRIHGDGRRVDKLECLKTSLGEISGDGRRRPEILEGTNFMVDADTVIAAIGEAVEIPFLPGAVEMNGPLIKVDHSGETSMPGVYAGGDTTNPSRNVAEAIDSGKRAAIGMDIFLRSGDEEHAVKAALESHRDAISMSNYLDGDPVVKDSDVVSFVDLNMNYYSRSARVQVSERPISARELNFNEVRQGLSRGEAVAEAERCFHCGHCNLCENCFIFCPDTAISVDEEIPSLVVNQRLCKACGICIKECPRDAIGWEGKGK